MITAIVYCSNTGFTKKYADMLSEKINIKAYSLNEALQSLKKTDNIIFMGWLSAGKIIGYKKASDAFTICCVCSVGITYPKSETPNTVAKSNNLSCPVFYMQGGVDYNKLHGLNKVVLKMVARMSFGKTPENDHEARTLMAMKSGGDLTKPEYLNDVIRWFNENN